MPAVAEAGAHPDGTTTLQFNRQASGSPGIEGTVDNIYVDLPPGFIGNPRAVPQCTSEQFAVKPLACPPETQVGVLRLSIEAVFADANMFGNMNERIYPVYNLEPRKGRVAEFGFGYVVAQYTTVRLVAKARTNGDFGVTALLGQIPSTLPPNSQSITLWGVPWSASNDAWRAPSSLGEDTTCRSQPGGGISGYIPWSGLSEACHASYDPSWGSIKPFISNETDCNPSPTARLATDAYQRPGAFTAEGDPDLPPFPALAGPGSNWKTYQSVSPPVTGCGSLGFDPNIGFAATSRSADGASGLDADLAVPQNNDPKAGGAPLSPPPTGAPSGAVDAYVDAATDYWKSPEGRATAHLKDTVVTLPAGVSLNPSAASGLQACTDAQIGLRQQGSPPQFNNGDPFNKDGGADGAECPDGSKLGTARVDTPLLEEPLEGEVVLGQPNSTDPRSGEMFRLFIVARAAERGLIAKIYGSTTADGAVGEGGTGQLVTRFLNNPEVPFDNLSLDIKGGERGLLALPERCGGHGWASTFTPWSSVGATTPVADRLDDGAIQVDANCAFGFSPGLDAGMSSKQARGTGAFSLRFTRNGGEQRFAGLTAEMPPGLLASVRDVPLCSSGQAAAGSCPAASRIGWVDGAAGSGTPFVLEQKGDVYLTEGYKGAPYGLLVRVPVVAGPFRGGMELTPLVIRQALHVDRKTAQVTAVSDPLPQVWHGIPLRVREVTAVIDRPGFMLNPSNCEEMPIGAKLTSRQGAVSDRARRFQASGCGSLAFKPKLALRLTGRKQRTTGKHPGVRARVTQTRSEAGIERAVVKLPKSLALDPGNAQALCEFEDGTKPDLENHCPKGSIVGRARAVSPLLRQPLIGNVYFVKNVRIDEDTGNAIRTLPMIIVALRGEIAVNLTGESSTAKNGRLINTFAGVPDAPISQFNLNLKGGKRGILAVTRTRRARIDICDGKQIAAARFNAHSGRRLARNVKFATPCPKGKRPKAKCRTQKQKQTKTCKQRAKPKRTR